MQTIKKQLLSFSY